MHNTARPHLSQSGFAGVVFLVIALIAVVMGAVALMSRTTTAAAPDQSTKTLAATIFKQGADFKLGFDHFLSDGSVAPASITFDENTVTGLFNPTAGARYAVHHQPPISAFAAHTAPYTYNASIVLPHIGSPSPDYVATLGGLTLAVCQRMNNALYGDALDEPPAISGGTSAQWTSAPASIDDGANTAANFDRRPEGCIQTADGAHVYYKALMEN